MQSNSTNEHGHASAVCLAADCRVTLTASPVLWAWPYFLLLASFSKWCKRCQSVKLRSDFPRFGAVCKACHLKLYPRLIRKGTKRLGELRSKPRDGDETQATRRVQTLVRSGLLPPVHTQLCVDCGGLHADFPATEKMEYDHHRGYEGFRHRDVMPRHKRCHVEAHRKRRMESEPAEPAPF